MFQRWMFDVGCSSVFTGSLLSLLRTHWTMNHPPHPPFGHPLPLGGGEGWGEGAV